MRNVVLVCGGRDFKDKALLCRVLDTVHADTPITLLVQGYARGADTLAHEWAQWRGVASTGNRYQITGIHWRKYGRAAGYHRNKKMRDNEQPDLVVAFPGGSGTLMMKNLSREKNIPTLVVKLDGTVE